MITAIIASAVIGLLVGILIHSVAGCDPYPFSLEDFERERRIRAENDVYKFYRDLENMRIDNLRLKSYPMYSWRNNISLEIGKLPRPESSKEAEEKYGKHWETTNAVIGKLNEVIEEVNNPTPKKFL